MGRGRGLVIMTLKTGAGEGYNDLDNWVGEEAPAEELEEYNNEGMVHARLEQYRFLRGIIRTSVYRWRWWCALSTPEDMC